jgi:hypothetical protein
MNRAYRPPMRRRVLALIAGVACALAGLAGTPIVEAASATSATAAPAVPVGAFDASRVRFDVRVVSGWAWEGPGPTDVRLYVGSQFVGQTHTGDPRPDVAHAHPSFGGSTGWHMTVGVPNLNPVSIYQTICAYAINPGTGPNSLLGCQRLFPPASPFDPVGALDAVRLSPGAVDLRGWAGDPDGNRTTQIRVVLDGSEMIQRVAASPRPDVQAAVPAVGATTGFHVVALPVVPGRHRLCIEVQNTGAAGSDNTLVGCRDIAVPDAGTPGPHDPRGRFDAIRTSPSSGHLTYSAVGWAFDPDSGGPVNVVFRTFIDPFDLPLSSALQVATLPTGVARPDVQAAFPAAGANAGFDGTIATTSQARVRYSCAYATNVGPGANRFLGCMTTPL